MTFKQIQHQICFLLNLWLSNLHLDLLFGQIGLIFLLRIEMALQNFEVVEMRLLGNFFFQFFVQFFIDLILSRSSNLLPNMCISVLLLSSYLIFHFCLLIILKNVFQQSWAKDFVDFILRKLLNFLLRAGPSRTRSYSLTP
jgi:hypothetical protein